MENITKALSSFSIQHNLWNLTKKSALQSINNYIEEVIDNNKLKFEEITLKPQKQELVFWYYENETFIIRNTYTLHNNEDQVSIQLGNYSLDVNAEGKIVDDWLIID